MKKVLSLALFLCAFAVLTANAQIGFVCNGTTYQNGDTIVVTIEKTAHNVGAISFKNQTPSPLRDLVVTLTEIENAGVEAWGLCTGDQCIPALTSSPFLITPNGEYNTFSIDIIVDEELDRPYGVYDMQISNGSITAAVVVRFQAYVDSPVGIDGILAASAVQAYPNPAQGIVNISYEAAQPADLVIYDIQGRLVSQTAVLGEGTLQFRDLPAGLYAYGISGQKMQKLIVR